ncbi:MAG TPA: OmpA family protein [Terriglobia bacterium]|nr:OmpA family protein [Terriglobia bacterium]
MARKKKHPEHVNHERWLVSYADFITLLFAFFVVMFAASNSDQKKAGKVAQAVQVAFKEMAVFAPSGKVVPLYDNGGLPANTTTVIGNDHSGFEASQLISASGKGGTRSTISEVKAQLASTLKDEIAKHTIRLAEDSRGLTVSLAEAGFFDAGSSVMSPKALAVVDRIAQTLRPLRYNVRVEGHTDNTPIHTAQFPSNWELSTNRATFLLQYLISNGNIPPQRLSAVGYGEYRPVASNSSAEGRAANRRVDLVVLGAEAEKLEPPVH